MKTMKKKEEVVKEIVLTYDDYAAIDDGNRYELAGGQLQLISPSPSVVHQFISFELQKEIANSCESEYYVLFAPVDVILSTTEVRQPDLILIHRDRQSIIKKRGIIEAPNLVVEILSPSTLKRDKIDKLQVYAKFQVPEYWIVEPTLGILEQYLLNGDRYELSNIYQQDEPISSPTISCISFTMDKIMSNIPELDD